MVKTWNQPLKFDECTVFQGNGNVPYFVLSVWAYRTEFSMRK